MRVVMGAGVGVCEIFLVTAPFLISVVRIVCWKELVSDR